MRTLKSMPLYGLYIRDLADGDLVWFTTEKSLQPGTYQRGRQRADSPNVYIAESIPGLILQVGPRIDEVERRARFAAGPAGTSAEVEARDAAELTEGLVQRLTQTSSIWEPEPSWVSRLRPFSTSGC